MKGRAAVLALVTMIASGCNRVPDHVRDAPPPHLERGWKPLNSSDGKVIVFVPDSWGGGSDDALGGALLGELLAAMDTMSASSNMKMMVSAGNHRIPGATVGDSISIIQEEMLSKLRLREAGDINQNFIERMVPGRPVERVRVELPIGPAERFRYEDEPSSFLGTSYAPATDIFILVKDKFIYTVTFTTDAARAAQFRQLSEQIMQTLRIK